MPIVFLISIIYIIMTVLVYYSMIEPEMTVNHQKGTRYTVIIFAAAFAVRIISALAYPGHETDMGCFDAWSDMLLNGFGNFYTSEAFTDYPPGYMYILYPIGVLKNLLDLDRNAAYFLLKLPSMVFDILSAGLIYKITAKHSKPSLPVVLASLYLFNPAVIINSSIWGQTDAVYTFFVIATLYTLCNKKTKTAYFLFSVAVFIKPQSLFYTPVIIFAVIEQVFINNFSKKKFVQNLFAGVIAIGMIFVLSLPFGINEVIGQYKNTLASYNYASVNAYNLWTALGLNWHELNPLISAAGYLAIAAIVAVSAKLFFSSKSDHKYFYSSAFICFATFMLSVKMHDRYAFAAIALILCAFGISVRKNELFLYAGISSIQFLNYAHTLFYYDANTYYSSGYEKTAMIISFIALVLFAYFIVYTKKKYIPAGKSPQETEETKLLAKVTKTDIIAMLAITVVYTVIALYNLGNLSAPQSYEQITHQPNTVIDLGDDVQISKIKFYLGSRELSESRMLTISIKNENNDVVYSNDIKEGAVFFWSDIEDINATGRYVTITSNNPVYINEMGVYTGDRLVAPVNVTGLTDEQELVPEFQSYKNSTYFDEIYHARTGYEFVNRQNVYEWTHPPLGKVFISWGIKGFGMTPFGWRIAGTLFGIFMIPFIYIFSKKMFGMSWLSICTSLMFAFDGMHFAQSRIATIDVYATFFIILMYLFMYKYYTMSFYDASISKTFIPLGLSGLAMGFAIACKWTGIYAGAGLAVIFFITMYRRFRESKTKFKKKAILTVVYCIFAFIAVPLCIYIVSYIPYMRSNNCGIEGVIQNQIDMFTYHGKTVVSSTHPYSSHWYQWPVNQRPILYYAEEINGMSEKIKSFGNPLVWWAGIPTFIFCIYKTFKDKDRNALFLVIAYLAQLVPWIFVTRTTFIYHYFPSVPFIVLMIGYSISQLFRRKRGVKRYAIVYTILCIIVFMFLYPVLSGFPVQPGYM